MTVVTADWISTVWACRGLQGYTGEGSVLFYVCVLVKGLGAGPSACMCFFLRSVHVCIFACICCTNTWCLCVHMQFSVCLNMSVCQGVEESDTHVLARTHCVGWGCVQSRILPMSPSLSVSRSCYCLLVRLLPLTLLPIVTCFIYRSNIDPCWRKWHSYCEVHTQGNKLEVCSSGHRSSFHVSQKYSLTIRDFSLTYRYVLCMAQRRYVV